MAATSSDSIDTGLIKSYETVRSSALSEDEIIAEAADGEEAVEKAKIECPDVAILDIAMPRMNGIEAAREILRFSPTTLVLTDSLYDVRILTIELKELGVKGFISKTRMATDLIPAIETVLGGGTCFGTEAARTA